MPTVSLRPGLAAACVFAAAACPSAHAAARADSPYALHSMIYADAPPTFKAAMFRHAAALGASSIRVDVSVAAIARADGRRDWSSLDAYMALARTYRLQVVGVLLDTPTWLAACPPRTPLLEIYRCPVSDPDRYARLAGEIAAHARGIIDDWEIRNEPDGRWAYLGTPRDYARELTAAAAAIHAANGRARVLLGGVMTLSSRPWLRAVLRTGAARAIDVANVHIRGSLAGYHASSPRGACSSPATACAHRCGSPSSATRRTRASRPTPALMTASVPRPHTWPAHCRRSCAPARRACSSPSATTSAARSRRRACSVGSSPTRHSPTP